MKKYVVQIISRDSDAAHSVLDVFFPGKADRDVIDSRLILTFHDGQDVLRFISHLRQLYGIEYRLNRSLSSESTMVYIKGW